MALTVGCTTCGGGGGAASEVTVTNDASSPVPVADQARTVVPKGATQATGGTFTLSEPAGAACIRSVTVVIPSGATASINPPDAGSADGQAAFTVQAGTYTWAVDGPGDCLTMPLTVSPTGGTAVILWTEVQ